jgi:AmmeMemoRadiSam system protein A
MNDSQRAQMLQFARDTVQAKLAGQPLPDVAPFDCVDVPHSGAFVTLRNRGRLRGCIGTFSPQGTLPETIRDMAKAACDDPRFFADPVGLDELGELRIETSVLSPLTRTDDPLSLELGTHGVYIRRGAASGCFLPQVATELGWDKETFLSQCCRSKAGLPADAWKDPDTEVLLFTAEVFGEEQGDAEGR